MKMNAILKSGSRLLLLSLTAAVIWSCGSDRSDRTRALLSTVPSNAGMVAVVNTERLLRDGGGKVGSDGKSEPGKELGAAIAGAGDYAMALLADSAGVDASVAVVFADGYYSYITGALRDAAAFEAFWTRRGRSFETTDGLRVSGNIAFTDAQFWCAPAKTHIDPRTVLGYLSLSEKRSWASRECAASMEKASDDIVLMADIGSMTQRHSSGGFSMTPIVLSMLFKNAEWISASLDIDDGKASFECTLLDAKFQPAEYLLPLGSVDPSVVKNLDCSAGIIAAVAVPAKLISSLSKKLPGGMPAMYESMLKPVNGTVAFAADAEMESGVIAVQTNGSSSAELREGLQMLLPGGETRADGKVVSVRRGSIVGKLPTSQFASRFKGAVAGAVFNVGGLAQYGLTPREEKIERAEVMATPDGMGLRLRGEVFSSDKKRYFLFTLLELGH